MCCSAYSGKKQSGLPRPIAARQFWFRPINELLLCWLVKTQLYSISMIECRGFGVTGEPNSDAMSAK